MWKWVGLMYLLKPAAQHLIAYTNIIHIHNQKRYKWGMRFCIGIHAKRSPIEADRFPTNFHMIACKSISEHVLNIPGCTCTYMPLILFSFNLDRVKII
jgi:hypothetical protein